MKESNGLGDRLFVFSSYVYLLFITLFCLFPFWIMIVASFTDDLVLRQDGYLPWAREWSLEAYRWVFKGSEVRTGYMVTLFVTIVGTLSSLFVMSGLAYVMALKRLQWRNKIAFYVFFTMVFTPSLIPWFITCRNLLQLTDTVWALILPMMVQPFWVFVLRNFFAALPNEIMESAYIDGASDATILFRIVLPLSKPALATVGLFMAVAYWNDWFLALMLLDFAEFKPLSLIILKMINNLQSIQAAMKYPGVNINLADMPTLSIRMATAVITIGPIILAYPFVQRYFVQGLTLGAVKG
ncbi:MAG: carbohydrate ABC transporter permease [Caldilineaceae bacterium]